MKGKKAEKEREKTERETQISNQRQTHTGRDSGKQDPQSLENYSRDVERQQKGQKTKEKPQGQKEVNTGCEA